MTHTPGPWTIHNDSPFTVYGVLPKHQYQICECAGEHVNSDEGKANARLIMAAPEMAEALAPFAVFAVAGGDPWKGTAWEGRDDTAEVLYHYATGTAITIGDFKRAFAALAKAKGE